MALSYSHIKVELKEILLSNKPSELYALSPKGTVPVLHINNTTVIDESLDIMKWALKQNDPNAWICYKQTIQFDIVEENDKEAVDITDKFMYNTFKTANMDAVLETVARIVKEKDSMTDLTKQYIMRLYEMIKNKEDFKLTLDPNDPEHPDNEDPIKWSGGMGAMAKLSAMLSYLAISSKNDEAFNLLSHLGSELYNLPNQHVILLDKITKYLDKTYKTSSTEKVEVEELAESILIDLRRKVA